MLKLQAYLKDHTIKELKDTFGISANQHGQYPNLYSFKYSMINSPMHEEIVQESRGIILDKDNDWAIVSFPYKKFFNYAEPYAAKIDWKTATCLEKLDGSLMTLYHYKGEWHVATSGLPDANGLFHPLLPGLTYKKVFWDVWEKLSYSLPTNTDECYMFEMMTQYNKLVCQYKRNRIVFHGARNIKTFEEKPYSYGKKLGWEVVRALPMQTLEEVLEVTATLDPLKEEGHVVVDANFNRIKIKSTEYAELSHLREGLSARRLVAVVVNNESDEFLSYFPHFDIAYNKLAEQLKKYIADLEKAYTKFSKIENIKDFVEAISDVKHKHALLAKRNKGMSFKDFFLNYNGRKLTSMMLKDLKMTEEDFKACIIEREGRLLQKTYKKAKPTIYLMEGLPGSGKSTKAKEMLADNIKLVKLSMDDLRYNLYGIKKGHHRRQKSFMTEKTVKSLERSLARTYLEAGISVIIDDTNLTYRRHRSFISLAKTCDAHFVIVSLADVPLETCLKRNAERDEEDRVPAGVIQEMHYILTQRDVKKKLKI